MAATQATCGSTSATSSGRMSHRRNTVLQSLREDDFELRNLFRPGGHDQLAANVERHAIFIAKGPHRLVAGLRHLRFQASRFVENAGMNHAAVAPCLVLGKANFLFHQKNSRKRIAAAKSGAGRKSNNSPTNNCEIVHTLPSRSLCQSFAGRAGLKSEGANPRGWAQ